MNVFKALPLKKWNEVIKRFMLIFLPLAFFFASLTVIFYFKDVNTEHQTIKKNESYKINSQMRLMGSKFKSIISDLDFLTLQSELADYLQPKAPSNIDSLAEELLLFSSIKKIYDQIQFINSSGLEIIKVVRENGISSIAPQKELQDKAAQSYFQKAIKLYRGDVFMSLLDLTDTPAEEEGSRPVIRFSMPLWDVSGDRQGIIVLSHPVAYLIDDLQAASTTSPGWTIFVTPNGFYLSNPREEVDGDDVTSIGPRNIEDILKDEWSQIRTQESGQFVSENGLITYHTIYPAQAYFSDNAGPSISSVREDDGDYLWKTISFVPQKVLQAWPEKILNRILLLYALCLIIIAICSYLLARTVVKRRQAEKAMRENEEELRAINEAAANAIIAIDNNKNVLHWNPAAERLFQYTAKEVVDKPITSIISPPKHQSTFTKISRKFRLPETDSMEAKTIELYGYKKDGTEFPVEVSFSAFKKGEQWHTVGIIRDISARKEMEKEVLRANKFESLGVLSSGIAHDFNNLLTVILGNINLVSKLSGTPPDSIELLRNAEKAARRVKALTQQLLTFSKDGVPIRKTTSIDDLIRDSVEYALHGSAIASSFDIPDDLLLVDIDAGQIGQVIQNVVTNSRQAISGSGAIIISCRNVKASDINDISQKYSGDYVEIEIHDTGHGIEKKHINKIFEPYFTTKDHGSGLGLTIAHSIIQRHDGIITVNSAESRGTTFMVYLPAAVDQHLPKEKEKKHGKGNRFKIMVVDKEEMLLSIAGRMLVHLGHECVCARSAREALDIYKHLWKTGSPVDGVIVDLTLPGGMGGKETAGAIFDINSEARIIVSSGFSNDPVMVEFDEYGFCAAIAKPFDMDELAEVIDAVLD